MPNTDPFMQAKALVGEDYVILSRHQLHHLIQWAGVNKTRGVDPATAFTIWVAEYALAAFARDKSTLSNHAQRSQ